MVVDACLDRGTGLWYIKVRNGFEIHGKMVCGHNHPTSKSPSSHPMYCRMNLTPEIVASIITDAEVGIGPSITLSRLQVKYSDLLLRSEDIQNTRKKIEAEHIGDMTRTEYLLSLLQKNGACFNTKTDEADRLPHLFFASHDVLRAFGESPEVILMDCTYKTNKFGMPLFNIVGVSGMNTTTHLAHVFMRGETIEDYKWALNSLKLALEPRTIPLPNVICVDRDLAHLCALVDVFPMVPVLLCLWHVVKAVETHAR
jgi:hypothetical protein